MKTGSTPKRLAALLAVLMLTNTLQAQDPATIWSFLGIPKGINKIKDASLNRRGNLPGTERTPPLKALSDPAFLAPEIAEGIPMPKPLMEAAKVKIQEDLAPQKIKAIKFLAKMGCGCYNDDGGIVDALAEALDDCTDDVRLATIKALKNVARGETCASCKTKSCCDEKLLLKLAELAYERDETGCYKEKNEDIREAAAEALETCCPNPEPVFLEESYEMEGGPETPPIPEVTPETPDTVTNTLPPVYRRATVQPGSEGRTEWIQDRRQQSAPARIIEPPAEQTHTAQAPATEEVDLSDPPPQLIETNRETVTFTSAVLGRSPRVSTAPRQVPRQLHTALRQVETRRAEVAAQTRAVEPSRQIPVFPGNAKVDWVDVRRRTARVTFSETAFVPDGTEVEIMHRFVLGKSSVGRFVVVGAENGGAIIRPLGRSRIASVSRGDEVRFLQ